MSIATKTGDAGTTGLMYNRRVSKTDPRVEAYGSVDELNAALGLARASATHPFIRDTLLAIQQDLVILMGELATRIDDLDRYARDGFHRVTAAMIVPLDRHIHDIEAQNLSYRGWAIPGDSVSSATLDLARTAARRAERRICTLHENNTLDNPQILVYLNRLSDLLWLLARWVEAQRGPPVQNQFPEGEAPDEPHGEH